MNWSVQETERYLQHYNRQHTVCKTALGVWKFVWVPVESCVHVPYLKNTWGIDNGERWTIIPHYIAVWMTLGVIQEHKCNLCLSRPFVLCPFLAVNFKHAKLLFFYASCLPRYWNISKIIATYCRWSFCKQCSVS